MSHSLFLVEITVWSFRSNKPSVLRDRCGKPKIKMASNMVKVSWSHDRSHTLIMEWDFLQCTVTA